MSNYNMVCKGVQTIIASAEEKYKKAAWPTQGDEEWRRSNPEVIPFAALDAKSLGNIAEDEINVHTSFVQELENNIAKIDGVDFIPWTEAQPDIVLNCMEKALSMSLDKVDVWRFARFFAGGSIIVKKETNIKELLHATLRGSKVDNVYFPMLAIVVERNASLSIDLSLLGDGFFSLGLVVYVGDNAVCNINQFQNTSLDSYNINTTIAFCEEQAEFNNISGQLGGMVTVDRVHASALKKKSNIHLNGYYFAGEDQLIDMRTYQAHIAEDAESRCLYHGLAIDQAHTVYRGLIEVGKKAVETDAYLTNKNLLLSEEARMDSIPCLNILTNDVRCSHGSTTGTLNEAHVFYLTSRGLSRTDAKQLLIEGFFQAVLYEKFAESNKKVNDIILTRIEGNI